MLNIVRSNFSRFRPSQHFSCSSLLLLAPIKSNLISCSSAHCSPTCLLRRMACVDTPCNETKTQSHAAQSRRAAQQAELVVFLKRIFYSHWTTASPLLFR